MEIRDEDLGQVFAYIGGLIREMNGIPITIGGIGNHVHILTSLPKTIALSDFVKNIKAYSSKWIKTLDESYYEGFCWQAGYGAFSVDYKILTKPRNTSATKRHTTIALNGVRNTSDYWTRRALSMMSGGRLRRIEIAYILQAGVKPSLITSSEMRS